MIDSEQDLNRFKSIIKNEKINILNKVTEYADKPKSDLTTPERKSNNSQVSDKN